MVTLNKNITLCLQLLWRSESDVRHPLPVLCSLWLNISDSLRNHLLNMYALLSQSKSQETFIQSHMYFKSMYMEISQFFTWTNLFA